MKCSSCSEGTLKASFLEGLFACHTCTHCDGNLFLLSDFLNWQALNPESDLSLEADIDKVSQDTKKAMICPLSGGLMTKYLISADTEHRLDLSPTINAVWLDKGEWALLKRHGLANKLNNIFTHHWQLEVRHAENAEMLDELYRRKFGDHYDDIQAFKGRLEAMENRSEVIAYLLSED